MFTFNLCLHWEKNSRGRYVGLLPFWEFNLFPWLRDDGDKGFFMWLWFQCGWYPVPARGREIGPFERSVLGKLSRS